MKLLERIEGVLQQPSLSRAFSAHSVLDQLLGLAHQAWSLGAFGAEGEPSAC